MTTGFSISPDILRVERSYWGRPYVRELEGQRGLMAFAEASACLGIHRITLARWVKAKRVKAVRYRGRRLVPVSEVLRLHREARGGLSVRRRIVPRRQEG